MNPSIVKRKLANNEPVLVAKSNFQSPAIVEMMGMLGFDCVWLCNEHIHFDDSMLDHLIRAARASGMDTMVRRNISGYEKALHLLEMGVTGLMIPRIRTVDYIKTVVEYSKFPPIGRRGVDGVNADADFGLLDLPDYLKRANEQTFIVAQIEDPEAVEIADDIAALDGVDVLFVGPADLSLGYGVPGQVRDPKIRNAINVVAEACKKHGKTAATPAFGTKDTKELLEMGYRLFTTSADYRFVKNGLTAVRQEFGELGFTFQGEY